MTYQHNSLRDNCENLEYSLTRQERTEISIWYICISYFEFAKGIHFVANNFKVFIFIELCCILKVIKFRRIFNFLTLQKPLKNSPQSEKNDVLIVFRGFSM